jgi:hypothetical protein
MAIGIAFHQREEATAWPNDLAAGMDIRDKRGTIDLDPGVGCDHKKFNVQGSVRRAKYNFARRTLHFRSLQELPDPAPPNAIN